MPTKELRITTKARSELVDITAELLDHLQKIGASSGLLTVFVPHTTAGVTINENADPDVSTDVTGFMDRLIPQDAGFKHGEGNSDSHIKSSLFSPSLTLIVEGGTLRLGTWQAVYLAEFDGPRTRQVWVKYVEG
ncbi:MAG: secondary thiamine-phosphate synthase enzyme YjbQ [Elusimicrobiota bacterium]|jgi:secondary thiamine-phosphate synthase enzyme